MALSVKVALVTCLGFIFGMSWLVSRVARPMVELPTPLVRRGPSLDARSPRSADVAARSTPVALSGRFAWPSPLEVDRSMNGPEEDALVVAEAQPPEAGLTELSLPPLYVPEAPVIAAANDARTEPMPYPGAGRAIMTMTTIPEAIIADTPARGARVLAALVGGDKAAEATAAKVVGTDADQPVRVARKYTVRRGDTLVKIMRREWNSDDAELLEVLLAANPQIAGRRDRIFPGEVLNIPAVRSLENGPAPLLAAVGTGDGGSASAVETGALGGASADKGETRWYTIRERDSLAGIARRLLKDETRWPEIARLNELRNADRILPGTRIKLPPAETDT